MGETRAVVVAAVVENRRDVVDALLAITRLPSPQDIFAALLEAVRREQHTPMMRDLLEQLRIRGALSAGDAFQLLLAAVEAGNVDFLCFEQRGFEISPEQRAQIMDVLRRKPGLDPDLLVVLLTKFMPNPSPAEIDELMEMAVRGVIPFLRKALAATPDWIQPARQLPYLLALVRSSEALRTSPRKQRGAELDYGTSLDIENALSAFVQVMVPYIRMTSRANFEQLAARAGLPTVLPSFAPLEALERKYLELRDKRAEQARVCPP
jgi:hypothetical protein